MGLLNQVTNQHGISYHTIRHALALVFLDMDAFRNRGSTFYLLSQIKISMTDGASQPKNYPIRHKPSEAMFVTDGASQLIRNYNTQ